MHSFSSEECDSIVEMAKILPSHSPTIGVEGRVSDDDYRRSVVRWIDTGLNPEFSWVHDKIWKIQSIINHEWFKFNVTHLPPLQFTEYDGSYRGEYKSHQDVFWLNDTNSHRKISIVVQLTDANLYDGGVLRFENVKNQPTDGDYTAMKVKGTVIAFPSFIFHKLEPVVRGRRHSLVAWFEGPKFQ
jgi:PKHD-type hydroxylase